MTTYRDTKVMQSVYQVRLDEQRILEANTVTAKCAACNVEHSVPVVINGRNTFRCRKCQAESVIVLNVETALTTTPLDHHEPN